MFYFSQWGFIFMKWQPDTVSITRLDDVSHVSLRGVFEYIVVGPMPGGAFGRPYDRWNLVVGPMTRGT